MTFIQICGKKPIETALNKALPVVGNYKILNKIMNKLNKKVSNQGFTLIEILVVIGIIAVLAAVVLIAINPARQFAQARNSQRSANVNAILNAIGQNMADHAGILTCGGVAFDMTDIQAADPTDPTDYVAIEAGEAGDIADCIVPDYIPALPFDPSDANGAWVDETDYVTGYTIMQDAATLRLSVRAPLTELDVNGDGTEDDDDDVTVTR